jgi:hypothetical protein
VASHKWGQPPAQVANLGHSVPSKFHPTQKLTKEYFTARAIFQDIWKDCEQDANLQAFLTRDYWHPNLVELADAQVLQAKASKYNEDNPSWDMAMNGPFADDFWRSCKIELDTLVNYMKTGALVPHTPDMHVLLST